MTLRRYSLSLFATLAAVAATSPALADSTGFDAIHSQMRVGKKTCFVSHSHSGSGSGATRKAAEMQAISSWYGYTAGEYGSDWANINKAIKRSMSCSGGAGNFSCNLEATPCR